MIKDILAPTDFSDCAAYALDAAFQFARQFGARITLFHRTESWPDPEQPQLREEEKGSDLEAHFRDKDPALAALIEQYPETPLRFVCSAKKPLHTAIREYVEKHQTDLIVMGSHGASGKNEYFIGSNTQKVVRTAHRPVLVIKEKLEKFRFDKIVFASNFHPEEELPFLRFKEVMAHFMPEFHLLMVRTGSIWEAPQKQSWESMQHFVELAKPFHSVSYHYPDFNVDQGIRSFAYEIGASLIGISNHHRHPLRRILIGSTVEALVNHSALPVLSMDYEE